MQAGLDMRKAAPIVAVVGALAFATTAAATPPRTDILIPPPGAPEVIGDCNGTQIAAQFQVTIRRSLFFDDAGDIVRVHRHITVSGTLTNLATGTAVTVRGVRVLTETADEFKATGSGVHVIVPTYGTVAIETGIERDATDGYVVHGRRDPFTETLCAALAP